MIVQNSKKLRIFCNFALAMNTQKTRRKLTPEFKAKVVIEAIREQSTLVAIAKKYEITQAQLSRWKKEFLANDAAAFGSSEQQQEMKKLEAERDSCHRKIGELEMELDFAKRVSKALGIPIPAKD